MTTHSIPPLDDLAVFAAVVDAGSFAAAARTLGQQKATVSRVVRRLEASLGSALLTRTTRALGLTESGAAVLPHAREAVAAAQRAAAVVDGGKAPVRGRLRVTTTPLLAAELLEPVVLQYLRRYRDVAVEIDTSPGVRDVVRDGYDLAIRAGAPTGMSLTSRVLGVGRSLYVASPAYLTSRGTPRHPRDLDAHDAVVVAGGPPWPFVQRGRRVSAAPRPRLEAADYELCRRAAVLGVGIARLPDFFVRGELERKRLVTVLEAWTPPDGKVYALFAGTSHVPLKTRAFLDLLARHVADHPLGNQRGRVDPGAGLHAR